MNMNILLHVELVLKWIKKMFLTKDKGCVHSFPPYLLHPFFKYFWTHCNSFNEQNAKLAVKKTDNAFSRFNEETGHSIVAPFWAIDKHLPDHSDLLSINAMIIALKTKQKETKKCLIMLIFRVHVP